MTNPNNFLINSDYPMDKVVYYKSGSFNSPRSTSGVSTPIYIDTPNLPFQMLPMMIWSETPDFKISNVFSDLDYAASAGLGGKSNTVKMYANQLIVDSWNSTGSDRTIHYRILGLAPSTATSNDIAAATSTLGNDLIFDSGLNYMKLLKKGRLATGSPTFQHNLGYIPTVLIWSIVNAGSICSSLVGASIFLDTAPTSVVQGVTINANQLAWTTPGTAYDIVEYRVYLDD